MTDKGAKELETNADNLERYSKRVKRMSDVFVAQGMIRDAFPKRLHGGYKAAVYAAYRYISPRVSKRFTERRARAIWDGEARRIDMEEADALRQALLEEAIREKCELRTRLAALDAKIADFEAAKASQEMATYRGNSDGMG